MAMIHELDWSGCPIVERDPLLLHGAPNINGKRITPETIVDNYEDGLSVAEIMEQFPSVDEQEIHTILTYAANRGYLNRRSAQ